MARELLQAGTAPSAIQWNESRPSLFSLDEVTPVNSSGILQRINVPKEFLEMAEAVAYARDEDRWQLLYRILFRLHFENPNLLKISVDSDILRAELLKKSVRRDIHKMHAFVRFKKSEVDGHEVYLAWHRPEHLTVRPGTPFFARRFGDRRWSIFTPDGSAHWDLETLTFGGGMEQHEFNTRDDWDEVWKTYYKSIFNPARIKVKMMKSEMSPKFWSSMPETSLIHQLIREAPQRLQEMAKNKNLSAAVDERHSIVELRESAKSCRACPLYAQATQTVFGDGDERADLMIVGEQPGDQEDLAGHPFVGPAGEILATAMASAGITRESVYLTNAVKHFKWKPQGKMRLHQKPSGREMHACKPWLEAEIARVRPKVILALGTTAATAVMGRLPKISAERGKIFTDLKIAAAVIISWHPAAILRASSDAESRQRLEQLNQDISLAAGAITAGVTALSEASARP